MKPLKILLFIIAIIACLTLIAFLFPTDGITLFNKTLRFPALTDIMTRAPIQDIDPEDILKRWEINTALEKEDSIVPDNPKKDRRDTIKHFETAFEKMSSTFELPQGNLSYFDHFFANAETAKVHYKIVRVLYYGDSQIELDRFSNNLRQFFQKKFGGGGPGMVPLYQNIPTGAINQDCAGNFTTFSLWGEVCKNKEQDYGPLAKMFRMNEHILFSAMAPNRKGMVDRRDNYSNISLLMNNLNGHFNAELTDRTNQGKYTLQTDSLGIQLLDFQTNFSTQSFSIKMNGNANIYGILIDDGFGVAVDNIAMRGANGLHFTSMQDSMTRQIFQMLNVGMIILQYGGNAVPGLSSEKSVEGYVASIKSQIRYLQRVAPHIPILFIGPSDMLSVVDGELKTYKYLPYLVDLLSTEIPKTGAAFWNMYKVMGGNNSMRAWVKKGWAGNDYVHFTSKGAQEIANLLTQTFETMYDYYKLEGKASLVTGQNH